VKQKYVVAGYFIGRDISLFLIFLLQIDGNYVGIPPPLEVTICNLNDNIDKAFLSDMVRM